MDAFKVPTFIPQDLLLIQELIGPQPLPKPVLSNQSVSATSATQTQEEDEDINSSDDEDDRQSEDEIAADLIAAASDDEEVVDAVVEAENKPLTDSSTGDSSSSDSESDSDSDEDEVKAPTTSVPVAVEADDDDEEGPGPTATNTYFQTKHEVAEIEVPVPDIDEVGADEVLERVGEVMNIMDNVAIIRGDVRGSDRALDSGTLLVFDDRKVIGYIYETFGPTTQPLYQVKFSSAFPLNQERVRVDREVFHVPARSNFVFVSRIKAIKGSDASNVHDEEPGEDEIEFSDDEAEAAHRSRLKRKRGESRARSIAPSAASSRASTPNPTLMRDQELAEDAMLSRGAFDEYSPYDIDYSVPGPSSRPAPIPYDDPYGDAYTAPDLDEPSRPSGSTGSVPSAANQLYDRPARGTSSRGGRDFHGRAGARGRDNRGRGGQGNGRERGRGRGGGIDHHGVKHQYGGNAQHSQQQSQYRDEYTFRGTSGGDSQRRNLSPTSSAIARVTGQSGGGNGFYPQQQAPSHHLFQQHEYYDPQEQYAQFHRPLYQQQQSPYVQEQFMNQGYQYPAQGGGGGGGFGMQGMPGVQPHINPRFASAFSFSFGMPQMQAQAQSSMSASTPHSEAGTNPFSSGSASSLSEWTVPLQSASANGSTAPSHTPSANQGLDDN